MSMQNAVVGALIGALVTEHLLLEENQISALEFMLNEVDGKKWLFAVVAVASLLSLGKVMLYSIGITSMIIRRDTKWKKNSKLDSNLPQNLQVERKSIVFIRHGESDWNLVFNKSKILLIPRLIMALIKETFLWSSMDSTFLDSPLSQHGIHQAHEIRKFLKNPGPQPDKIQVVLKKLQPNSDNTIIVSSNLRRAIATACVGLREKVQASGGKVKLLSCLQEISPNVDTLAIAAKHSVPVMKEVEKALGNAYQDLDFDTTLNFGNKPLFGNGQTRMQEFNKWVFEQQEECIIAAGHSIYFRSFFKEYLHSQSNHIAKRKKMQNCAIVHFFLEKGVSDSGEEIFRVAEDSITPVFKDFEQ